MKAPRKIRAREAVTITATLAFAVSGGVALVLGACSSSSSDTGEDAGMDGTAPHPGLDSSAADSSAPGDAASPQDATMTDGGADAGGEVTFAYHPSWLGVTAASVYGQFGTATDWTAPFLTLTSDGQGGFTGSAALPAGSYAYVLQTTGDADGPDGGATTKRPVGDPTSSSIIACPAASPTYAEGKTNPCSLLTVPSPGASALHHVSGTVTNAGAPASGWLVQIERNETGYHHFFVDRTTTGTDGTFDLVVAAGGYQLFVENPGFLSETDAEQKPQMLATYRRELSDPFGVDADVATAPPSVGYPSASYAAMGPRGDAGALPTTFVFTLPPLGTHLAVYDGVPSTIGDPYFTSALVTDGGSAVFDGGFNTAAAGDAGFVVGQRYFWGVEDELGIDGTHAGAADAGLTWTGQTLVFAVSWE